MNFPKFIAFRTQFRWPTTSDLSSGRFVHLFDELPTLCCGQEGEEHEYKYGQVHLRRTGRRI